MDNILQKLEELQHQRIILKFNIESVSDHMNVTENEKNGRRSKREQF